MPKWIDLSRYNAKLTGILFPDGKKRLVISGLPPNSPLWNKVVRELGFVPAQSGKTLLRNDVKISPNDFKKVFILSTVKDLPREEIIHTVRPQVPASKKEDLDLRTTMSLGLNFQGDEVFSGEMGRFIRSHKNTQIFTEEDIQSPAAFLRFDGTDKALRQCTDGFIEMMLSGKVMRTNDILKFASVIYSDPVIVPDDGRMRVVQEGIEAALIRKINAYAEGPNEKAFRLAMKLYENQPPFTFVTGKSKVFQQYSTPPPMAVVAQRLLGNTANKIILEPTIGNCSLVSTLSPDAEIIGIDLDSARVGQSRNVATNITVANGDATTADFSRLLQSISTEKKAFDCVIANPPFGGLAPQNFDGLKVTRIDHLIALRSLASRTDDGRAVFVIAADRENIYPGKEGIISGGSKNFFNWLTDHYDVEDAVEVSGKLYAKQGASYPIRIVTVGRRRSAAEVQDAYQSKAYRRDTVPVIRSWDDLWEHTENVCSIRNIPAEQPKEVVNLDGVEDEKIIGVEERLIENAFQAPYITSSTMNEASSMIPRNLLGPSQTALGNLAIMFAENDYLDVEDYLVSKLNTDGFTREHIADVFSAEQIDALALGIANAEKGRELIVGDQTGLGKGRILAGMALYAIQNHGSMPVVFLTEKGNLFSDFWRDIEDVCGTAVDATQLFRPFILNAGQGIRDQANKMVFKATSPAERKAVMANGEDGLRENGYNIMFATYSQFNREAGKSQKAAWLPVIASNSFLIKDESHNAAGDSNTARNITAASDTAWGGVNSSATFAKKSENLIAYRRVFPKGVCDTNLGEVLAVGGEPLQEIMSGMLVEDGVLVRREHDLSKLEFITHEDTAHLQENEQLSDKLSEILLSMSHLSGDVRNMTAQMNKEFKKALEKLPEELREGSRISVSSVNFGSRLYNILRQFLLSIKVAETADQAVRSLKEGRKPVIIVEQTMETILKEVIYMDRDLDEETDTMKGDAINDLEIPQLTFRDLLSRMLEKITVITKQDDYGSVEKRSAESYLKTEQEVEAWAQSLAHMRGLIADFPELDISPLDSLRYAIKKAGFSCGEISGRSLQLEPNSVDNNVKVLPRIDDRLQTNFAFNNGDLDAIILTRAGSTGLSLHSSAKFADQRQREIIELQIANDVNNRMQFYGRVNRKAQVNTPIIRTLSSGLPSETRILAMQNVKLRKLSANTQSNRENAAELSDIPDILNSIGNKICFRFLENNPSVSHLLDIPVDDEMLEKSTSADDAWFANKLTGRIALLPIKQQKEIYEQIFEEYNTYLMEMETLGKNPFKTKIYDLKAKVINRELFEGAERQQYDSAFDRPVYVSTLEWTEDVDPIRFQNIVNQVNRNLEWLAEKETRVVVTPVRDKSQFRYDTTGLKDIVKARFNEAGEKAFENIKKDFGEHGTIHDAVGASKPNAVKNIHDRAMWLVGAIDNITPGKMIEINIPDTEPLNGTVVSIKYPDMGREHLLGQYHCFIAVPGKPTPDKYTFNMLSNNYISTQFLDKTYRPAKEVYDTAPQGMITKVRTILDGNLFRAAQIAVSCKMGRAAIFTDENGISRRAIMLSSMVNRDMLQATECRIDRAETAKQLFELEGRGLTLKTEPKENKTIGASISKEDQGYSITVNGKKMYGEKYYANDELIDVAGSFSGNRTYMKARFSDEMLEEVLTVMEKMGCAFYAPAKFRDQVNDLLAQENQVREAQEKPANYHAKVA
jgi:hypothetical protein